MADEDGPASSGLDPDQWREVFGVVLDELRASTERARGSREPPEPAEPPIGPADDVEDSVDEPSERRLVCEDGR